MKTTELLERIGEDYGVRLDRRTIDGWCSRPANALPQTKVAMRGQARDFDWSVVKPWVEWRLASPGGMSLDAIRQIPDIATRLRLLNRYRRVRGMPPPMEGGTWSEGFHP